VKREGVLHPYGVDAPLVGYSYFYEKLQKWIIDKMNNQKDFGPLEDISLLLEDCNYPKQALVSIGATAYAEFGEKHYLQKEDEVYVVAYDKRHDNDGFTKSDSKIILHQYVK
jgi:hypothetical protein